MIPCIILKKDHLQSSCSKSTYLEILKALLQLIPLGKVTTYKDLARLLNTSPRVIGALLKLNDRPIVVPCHRVVRSDGNVGGYTWIGQFDPDFKKRLLLFEGIRIHKGKIPIDFIYSLSENYLNK